MPLIRIPYTQPLPLSQILPRSAATIPGAVDALQNFLGGHNNHKSQTLILTGAGISVASGLADYRGPNGTYILNKTYRPIYYHEFTKLANHSSRQRYWARSFLGWTTLHRSRPNASHLAVRQLGELGLVKKVVTQNVDSFHHSHPGQEVLELHGYLRATVCLSCRTEFSRAEFQQDLSRLNPSWSAFLASMLESGALGTEDPVTRQKLGLKTNPDGDVDVPGVNYETFRYPPCPSCLANPEKKVAVDSDGAWSPEGSEDGVLKPAVIMFGESIPSAVKVAAEEAVDSAERVLVLGSSLATYSAWRLVKRAKDQGKRIAVVNMGGVRGEENFFADVDVGNNGTEGVRCSLPLEEVLPGVVERLQQERNKSKVFTPAPWA